MTTEAALAGKRGVLVLLSGDVPLLTAETLHIDTRRRSRLFVATDGEVTLMDMPLEYRVRPRDLRVIVPAPEPARA